MGLGRILFGDEKVKCLRCNGTGKVKDWIETETFDCTDSGETFYYNESRMVDVPCPNCNGTGEAYMYD